MRRIAFGDRDGLPGDKVVIGQDAQLRVVRRNFKQALAIGGKRIRFPA